MGNNWYAWATVAALLTIIGFELALIKVMRENRRLRRRIGKMYTKALKQRRTDEALLQSAKNTIAALDEDFDQAVKLSVEQMVYWRGVARGLAREIKEQPTFDSHLTGSAEGCTLCDLLRQAEQA